MGRNCRGAQRQKRLNPGRQRKGRKILRHYQRVKFLVDRYRRYLILGTLALIATDLAGMALPWLIKGGIDTALRKNGAGASLVKYPLLILLAASLQGFFRYCWRININGLSRRSEADLRDRVFAHLQLPLSYFQHTKTGDLMSRLTNDIQAVRELLGFGTLAIVDAVVVIVFSVAMMIAIDPLTLWSIKAMPLISVAVRISGGVFSPLARHSEQLSASAFVQENPPACAPRLCAGAKSNRPVSRAEHRVPPQNHVAGDALGHFLAADPSVIRIAATIVLWLGGRQVLWAR
jgi:ATP-binding cassette subfamily B protein